MRIDCNGHRDGERLARLNRLGDSRRRLQKLRRSELRTGANHEDDGEANRRGSGRTANYLHIVHCSLKNAFAL